MAPRRMTKANKLERWRLRIEESQRWRKDEGYDDLWSRLIDLYAGKHFEGLSHQDRVAVNIAFSTLNIIYPSITINHPKITLTARDPEQADKATIAEAVMDYMWKDDAISAGDEYRLAVKDYLTIGHGWVKTGWRFREEAQPRSEEDIQAEFAELQAEVERSAQESPEMAHQLPTDEDILEGIERTEMVAVEDRVFVERVSPFDVVVDTEATTPRNMKWMAHKVVRTVDEVRKDPRYTPAARKAARPDAETRHANNHDRRRRKSDVERITVWEFYDLEANQVATFAAQGEGFLVEPQPIPYNDGLPFVMLRNYEVPDCFYPMGDLESLEPLQHELNRTRSQLQAARQNYVRKYIADEQYLDSQARTALSSRNDGEVVLVNTNNGQIRLSDVIQPIPINQLPADLFGYGEMVGSDMNQVSGVSEYQRGGGADIRRTATEAAMIQDAVNARSADKLAEVERGIARVARGMLNLARQFLTGEHVARVTGVNGMNLWVHYSQETIDVDADFVVEGGSTTPKNEGYRQEQAMKLITALGPLVGQVVDPMALARHVLQAHGITNAERFLMAPPPPMGMPPGGPGGPGPEGPGGPPMGPPPDMPPPDMPPEAAPPGGVDPNVLAQLAGQVGLNLS